jgi:hypothetical protein
MSETNMYVTKETFDKMREELQKMKSVDRPAASKAIAEAREKGDLKENAEYDAAKEAQGMLEAKIKQLEGAIVVSDINNLMTLLKALDEEEIFIIGGASIYEQMIHYADKLYVTHIFEDLDADTFFPKIGDEWEITKISAEKQSINHKHPHIFTIYEK